MKPVNPHSSEYGMFLPIRVMREVASRVGTAAIGTAEGVANPPRPTIFRAEGVEIDLQLGSVKRAGVEQPLRQQSFHVLLFLLERRCELVHKEELVASFWHDASVTDNALVQCIADIRRALGDDPRNPRFIKTVPRAGYRFIAEVDEVAQVPSVAVPEGQHQAGLKEAVGAEGQGAGRGQSDRPTAVLSFVASTVTPGMRELRFKSPKLSGRQLVWTISGLVALGAFAFGLLYLRARGSD